MVLSEEQTKLIQEEGAEPGKTKKAPATKRVNNSKELYGKVQEINLETQRVVKDLMDAHGAVASTVIDVREELTRLTNGIIEMSGRLDDICGPVVIDGEEESEPAPQTQGDISRDALDNFKKQISARDAELGNKKFSNLMERMCLMREDYRTLCKNMRKDLASFSAADVLTSFEAYLIDMENMLYDAGIAIGPYGKDGDQVDVAHQRIVGVTSTDDPAKNGTVAARLSEGYEYNGRALVKEKVNVYKVADKAPKKPEQDEVMEILG